MGELENPSFVMAFVLFVFFFSCPLAVVGEAECSEQHFCACPPFLRWVSSFSPAPLSQTLAAKPVALHEAQLRRTIRDRGQIKGAALLLRPRVGLDPVEQGRDGLPLGEQDLEEEQHPLQVLLHP